MPFVPRTPTFGRVLAAGLFATLAAVTAIVALRAAALFLFEVDPGFTPIQSPSAMIATSAAGVGATLVLALLVRTAERPVERFLRLSGIVFGVSLLPPLALLVLQGPYPGTTVATVGTLVLMHVVAALTVVGVTLDILTERRPLRAHEGSSAL